MPWKYLAKNAELVKAPIVLYWLPVSREEVQRSPMLTSRALLEASGRCVGLEIVLPDDAVTIAKLGGTESLPKVVLTNAQGHVIRTVRSARGGLPSSAVEQTLAEELRSRDDAVFTALTEARKSASGGDKEKAIDLYTKIWNDRCLYPLVGTEAQRGLKNLGVLVQETPTAPPVDPNMKVTKKHE